MNPFGGGLFSRPDSGTNYSQAPQEAGYDFNNPDATQADILRRDYLRQQTMYRPLQDLLFENLVNWEEETRTAQQSALIRTQRNFRQGQESFGREIGSYGIQLNPEQRKSLDRQYDISAARAAIDAANKTGTQMNDTRMGLVGGLQGFRPGA